MKNIANDEFKLNPIHVHNNDSKESTESISSMELTASYIVLFIKLKDKYHCQMPWASEWDMSSGVQITHLDQTDWIVCVRVLCGQRQA